MPDEGSGVPSRHRQRDPDVVDVLGEVGDHVLRIEDVGVDKEAAGDGRENGMGVIVEIAGRPTENSLLHCALLSEKTDDGVACSSWESGAGDAISWTDAKETPAVQ